MRKLVFVLLVVGRLVVGLQAQVPVSPLQAESVAGDRRPKLEFEPDLNLNGGGFQPVSGSITGGFGMQREHLAWDIHGTYDTARKVNDGTKNNSHGNVRVLSADLCGRTTSKWLYCGYAAYANLRTTNYEKNAVSAAVGAGYDFEHVSCPNCTRGSFSSMRLIVLYGLPLDTIRGKSDADKEHAIKATFTIPSPLETNRHIFFVTQAEGGWVRNNGLHSHYQTDGGASFGLLFRY